MQTRESGTSKEWGWGVRNLAGDDGMPLAYPRANLTQSLSGLWLM